MTDPKAVLTEVSAHLERNGDPRAALAMLQVLPVRGPNHQAGMLEQLAWIRIARREGPSAEAEAFFFQCFEAGLAVPNPYEGDLALLTVLQPLRLLEEYLVMQGRFDEAKAANTRAIPAFGLDQANVLVEPREDVLALAAAFSRIPGGEAFDAHRQAEVVARTLASLRTGHTPEDFWVGRREAPLPDGRTLEIVLFGFPAAIRTNEPFFVAHARTKGSFRAHVFHLAWRSPRRAAFPIALDTGPGGTKTLGESFSGGAPCGLAGFASPFVEPFVAFIQAQLAPLSANEPTYFGGKPLPGIGADELLSRIDNEKAAEGRRWKRFIVVVGSLALVITLGGILYVAHAVLTIFGR